jgi:FkbH-like protein
MKNSEILLTKMEWQDVIFASYPKRYDLQKMKAEWDCSKFVLQVHRNQAFEFIGNILIKFLNYSDLTAHIIYSDYDDSLSFKQIQPANVELVWLEYERYDKYHSDELLQWLFARIKQLRGLSSAPILINDWAAAHANDFNQALKQWVQELPDVYLCSQYDIFQKIGTDYFSKRTSGITSSQLSDLAFCISAQRFGLNWIPSVLKPRLKAIVVDMDNTLYSGVLGEDGVQGIALNEGYKLFHQALLAFREQGIFLAICSRNEVEDVKKLFEIRDDFPLKLESFSTYQVNWESKANNIKKIADALRISTNAILFIDDNIGELVSVIEQISDIKCLHATDDPYANIDALNQYPNLWTWDISKNNPTDKLRIFDLETNSLRQHLEQEAASVEDYLQSLKVCIDFFLNHQAHSYRLHELSIKTNQFNTALSRLSETEVQRRLHENHFYTVSLQLRDRLSDSGIVASIYTHYQENTLFVDEICISCRALGRGLESIMIYEGLLKIVTYNNLIVSDIAFFYRAGSRNQPAFNWLQTTLKKEPFSEEWNYITLAEITPQNTLPITISWNIP